LVLKMPSGNPTWNMDTLGSFYNIVYFSHKSPITILLVYLRDKLDKCVIELTRGTIFHYCSLEHCNDKYLFRLERSETCVYFYNYQGIM
jgi:hypothetical protein